MSKALEILAALRLEDGRRWGEAAVGVQWKDARAVFRSSGPRRHWLGRSRGYSKTTDVAAITIAAMVADAPPPGAQAIAAAGDQDQARLLARAIDGFAKRTPELRGLIKVQANRITGPNISLEIVSSDASTTFGITPWLLLIDELAQWPWSANAEAFYSDALMPSLAKTPDARCIVITTAGRPGSWQYKAYRYALAESDLWRVSETHGPPPWMPKDLVAAERRRLSESSFARWFENRWVESDDALASADDIAAAVSHDGPLDPQSGSTYIIGVDLGTRHDPSVAVVAHRERDTGEDPVVVVDRLMVWQGSRKAPVDLTDVEAWVRSASKTYNAAKVRVESWQGAAIVQRLRSSGVEAEEVFPTQSDGSKRTTALMLALRDRRLRIPSDDELVRELQSVVVIETAPNVYRVDHRAGGHNDRVIALSLAAAPLLEKSVGGMARVLKPRIGVPAFVGETAPSGWAVSERSGIAPGVQMQEDVQWSPPRDAL